LSFTATMEPATKKLKYSEEKCLDPFENALFEHLLQELMFQHLTVKEFKRIYEVSTLWDEIASASKTCGDKLELKIDNEGGKMHEKLQVISGNSRKYGSLLIHLNYLHKTRNGARNMILLPEIFAGLGSTLKVLHFSGSMKTSDVVVLLRSLPNLKDLQLPSMFDDTPDLSPPLQLPKLRNLTLRNPDNLWLKLFSKVSSLEEFDVFSNKTLSSCRAFENFVLLQEKLKKLSLDICHPSWGNHPMFNDVSRVKFRLKSISINGLRITKDNAVKFFDQQQSLKQVGIGSIIGISFAEYTDIFQSIWTLPKLKSFQYGGGRSNTNENLVALNNIWNGSVKEIRSLEGYEAVIDGRMFDIFPNLETYRIEAKHLELKNVPSEKLKIIEGDFMNLVYQPPLGVFDQAEFESEVVEFIRRFNKIQYLNIGRDEWIQQGVRLSTNFWKNVIDILRNMREVVIRHSGDITEIVEVLIDSKRYFDSVKICTNAVGRASVEGMKLPWSWQIIRVVE
jgi:hypothetical protein